MMYLYAKAVMCSFKYITFSLLGKIRGPVISLILSAKIYHIALFSSINLYIGRKSTNKIQRFEVMGIWNSMAPHLKRMTPSIVL